MSDRKEWVCAGCGKIFSHDEPTIVSHGLRFHSEACWQAWDRLWGRLAFVAWIGAVLFIALVVFGPI